MYRRSKDLFKNRCKKYLHYIFNLFPDSEVQVFVIKHNLFCQLPADVLIVEKSDLSFLILCN